MTAGEWSHESETLQVDLVVLFSTSDIGLNKFYDDVW